MTIKYNLKEKAIVLRKEGRSYSEILKEVPVAKSTLSIWLHSIGLARHQKQRLTEKKIAGMRRGADAQHEKRIDSTRLIIGAAKSEIGIINRRELWLIGVILYWAEGSKQKEHHPGAGVRFTNMDPAMICLFLRWLKEICMIEKGNLIFHLYIHETHRSRMKKIIKFWSSRIGLPIESFSYIYFKRGNIKTNRKNVHLAYFGVMVVIVKSSAQLNRQIAGWTQGVVEFFR